MIAFDHLWLLALALILDALVGDPPLVWRTVPHPVAWIGGLIGFLDSGLNRPSASPRMRRILGMLALVLVAAIAATAGWTLEWLLLSLRHGWIGIAVIASIFLAGRSLFDHVHDVRRAFAAGGLPAARKSVSRIVGRDPASLDEAGVCRAAIESTAENFSDGVVAPALWFALLGLPGMLAYKAINTADSMIGHLTPRYVDFGRAAAKADDLVNLPASRLSGLLIALAAPLARGSAGRALAVVKADARKHRSPNAGWPEAAMAGALGIALAGPRRYRGVLVDDPFLNAGCRRRATPDDIGRALRIYLGAAAILFLIVVAASAPAIIETVRRW
ncbi:MAG TPA: adenosylcobinamide-phosphate synthase CbiB [Bauldia sp.]|nr:adenosylcobinamide-phosphate synthase CbiB [Bauldia sp.]